MTARHVLLSALVGIVLSGCSATPQVYSSDRELGSRPGLLSGDKGAFVVRPGSEASPAPAAGDYEAYQSWKDLPEHADERREFEEWREWQRFKAWKEGQGE